MVQSKIKRTIKRSSLYHLLQTGSPTNHGVYAKVDLCGAAIVIGLVISAVLLMRMLLSVQ